MDRSVLTEATDEMLLAEIVRRAQASPLHGLIIAACRPDEGGVKKFQVHMIAGSMDVLDLLVGSIGDAVSKRKIEMRATEHETSSARRAPARRL